MSEQIAQVHRFHNDVAVNVGGKTAYLTPLEAYKLAAAISGCAMSCEREDFQTSTFGTFMLKRGESDSVDGLEHTRPDMLGARDKYTMPLYDSRRYAWLHVPSGRRGERETTDFPSAVKFMQALDRWNRIGRGQWQYWSI